MEINESNMSYPKEENKSTDETNRRATSATENKNNEMVRVYGFLVRPLSFAEQYC